MDLWGISLKRGAVFHRPTTIFAASLNTLQVIREMNGFFGIQLQI